MSSQIQFRAFTIQVGSEHRQVRGMTINDFMLWAADNADRVHEIDGERFAVRCENHGHCTSGVVINFKGNPAFETIDEQTLQRHPAQSLDGTQAFSCNLWAINREYKIGVYQSQAQSVGLSDFRRVMSKVFDGYKVVCREKGREQHVNEGLDPAAAEKKAEREISGHITIQPSMTTDEFLQLVGELNSVKSFRYRVDVSRVVMSRRYPWACEFRDAQVASQEIRMRDGSKPAPIKRFVRDHMSDLKAGTVVGIGDDGIEKTYRLTQHAEIIERMSAAEWGNRLPDNLRHVEASQAMGTVLRLLRERAAELVVDCQPGAD